MSFHFKMIRKADLITLLTILLRSIEEILTLDPEIIVMPHTEGNQTEYNGHSRLS